MTTALLQIEGSRAVGQHDGLDTLIHKYGVDPSYFTFRFVRHPADWLVTHFHHQTGWHKKGFDAFVRNYLHDRTSVFWLDDGLPQKYESLNGLLELGPINVSLPTIGVTKNKQPFRSYYSEDLKNLMLNRLIDWEVYEYSW